jgi:hypothetical protein
MGIFMLLASLLNYSTTIMRTSDTLLISSFWNKPVATIALHNYCQMFSLTGEWVEHISCRVTVWWPIEHSFQFASSLHYPENVVSIHVTVEMDTTVQGRCTITRCFVASGCRNRSKYWCTCAVTVLLLNIQEFQHSNLGYPTSYTIGFRHPLPNCLAWIKLSALFLDYHQKMLQ